jgi:hypothetical protein
MSRPKQSLSQLFTSFGPGAMMDLPTRSVVVAGLDHWDAGKVAFKDVKEPRLTALLQAVLTKTDRWEPGKPVQLRTPPIAQETRNDFDPAGVAVRVFPTWFTCEGITEGGADPRRRRLVRWTELDAAGGRKKFQRDEDGKKVDVSPIRFVGACKKGHLQDIDWKWLIHRGAKCEEPMWIEEQGTSADPANIRIGCLCDRPSVSLSDAFKPGFLGICKGQRPWLDSAEAGCPEQLHFLSRSATNTYFPQTVTIISLPVNEDALGQAIRKNWTSLQSATDPVFVGVLKNVPEIGAALGRYSNDEIYARILQLRETVSREAVQDPKIAEFDLLGSGAPIIGADARNEPLFGETLNISDISKCKTRDQEAMLQSVVGVHRLRAVTCLYGFTRLEPAMTYTEEMLEDVRLTVDGAPLSETADWLPAMEQLGEGIFLKIRPEAVRAWLKRQAVQGRGESLAAGTRNYANRHKVEMKFPGLPYILLHSLSHVLMGEIALDCGYPLSSLKERVYAIIGNGADRPDRFGILIYTASSGAQGTLGGLTAAAERIPTLVANALERLSVCSNDPVCADHDPSVAGDERSLLGAACHACLLVPETSCEARNNYLDRTLLAATVAEAQAGLFKD